MTMTFIADMAPRKDETPEIRIEEVEWRPSSIGTDNAKYALTGKIRVCGVDMHLTAVAVREDADGIRVALDADYEDTITAIEELNGDRCRIQEMDGLEYMLVAYPWAP